MKTLKPILTLIPLAFVAACASVQTFNMPKVEDNLNRAFQKSEEISGNMKEDFNQKKNLLDSLRKTKSSAFKESESELKNKLAAMEKHLNEASGHSKTMTEAKGHVVALGYAKPKIRGDEPEYARVEEAVKDFETAAAAFTASASEYSRESNSLADVVANKKLYFNFEVADFQKKVQQSISSSQENAKIMDREIQRTEDIRNSFEDESRRIPVEQALAQMISVQKEHTQKIKELNELNSQMVTLAQGQAKIPSTMPNWSEVQRVVSESDRASLTLNELYKDFQAKVDRVRGLRP